MNTLPLTSQELGGMSKQERKVLEEIVRLAREDRIEDAVQKAAEIFNEVWKLRTVVRVIYGELVREGHGLRQAYSKVKKSLQKMRPNSKRQIMQEGLEDHYRDVREFSKALRKVAGIWADHPDFDGVDVRTWRRKLWK